MMQQMQLTNVYFEFGVISAAAVSFDTMLFDTMFVECCFY